VKINTIGYYLYDYPVPSETWIPLEIKEWKRRGVKVKIYTEKNEKYRDNLNSCDFVLSHFAHIAQKAGRLGKPFGFVAHAWDIWTDDGKAFRETIKMPNCKMVGYISDYHKQKFVDWGCCPDKLVFWGASLDTDLFTRKRTLGKRIICGGRFVEKKGLDLAIQAVPDITLFGEGELKEELLSISDRVDYVGWLDRKGMKRLMEDAYLLIAPSIVAKDGDTEGISTIVLEAVLMNLNVITTSVAGNEEIAGVTFVNPDVDEIRAAVDMIPHKPNFSGDTNLRSKRSPKAIIDNLSAFIENVEI